MHTPSWCECVCVCVCKRTVFSFNFRNWRFIWQWLRQRQRSKGDRTSNEWTNECKEKQQQHEIGINNDSHVGWARVQRERVCGGDDGNDGGGGGGGGDNSDDKSNHSHTIISAANSRLFDLCLNVIDHVKIYLMNCRWKRNNNKMCMRREVETERTNERKVSWDLFIKQANGRDFRMTSALWHIFHRLIVVDVARVWRRPRPRRRRRPVSTWYRTQSKMQQQKW